MRDEDVEKRISGLEIEGHAKDQRDRDLRGTVESMTAGTALLGEWSEGEIGRLDRARVVLSIVMVAVTALLVGGIAVVWLDTDGRLNALEGPDDTQTPGTDGHNDRRLPGDGGLLAIPFEP